jgi:hypothetical protein
VTRPHVVNPIPAIHAKQVTESGKCILEVANEEMGLTKIDTTYPYIIEDGSSDE